MICLVEKWHFQLPSSLVSAHKPPGRSQSSARLLQGKLSSLPSDCAVVTSALRHFHLAFPAHPGNEGLWSQHTLTLYGSPTGNTSLRGTHWKCWLQNTNRLLLWWGLCLPNLGSDCVLQPELVWGAKLKFSLEILGPELSHCWASAWVHLTFSVSWNHSWHCWAPGIALPEKLKNSLLSCIPQCWAPLWRAGDEKWPLIRECFSSEVWLVIL